MIVDLIQTKTRDGMRLDGIFQESSAESKGKLEAACFIHGTGGNFYSSTLFDFLGQKFLERGCSVLRANTRGHDGMSTAATSRGGVRLGAAYEVVDDCRHDLTAWLEWLKQLGIEGIALVGHSLGAVKAVYAVAQEEDLPVTALIAISPPRLSYSWFCSSQQKQVFLETYQKAEQLIADGEPETLMEVTVPLGFVITAAGYQEKYGPEERYNFHRFIAGVKCPLLVTFGSVESQSNMAFQSSAEDLQSLSPKPPKMTVATIDGGDHFYSAVREDLAACIEKWVQTKLG